MRDFENLGAYLPATVLKQLVDGHFKMPQEQNFKTVCLFADVSGFTVLSEKLCAEGQDGIEELAAQLNKYMAQVVKLTSRAGGDVLKFAGDALISIFNDEQGDLVNALLRAIQCSLDMQLRLTDFGFSFRKTDSEGQDVLGAKLVTGELNIKLGIGMGDCSLFYVGGESDNVMPERYEYVAMGQALEEAFEAEGVAVKGQVVISKSAFQLISSKIECEPIGSSHYLVKAVRKSEGLTWRRNQEVSPGSAPTMESENNIWRCVPAAVLPYLNESNEFWAPELRRVTTLFVNLGYSEADMAVVDMNALHQMYRAMQRCVFQFEGTINKFLCDDKGSTLVVVFGLPPFAHENDATRGVLAAMSILSTLKELGKDGSVGITTGEAFCGVVGTRGNRREYSVIGDVVNVSARLMSVSKKQRCGHLMDKASQRAIESDGFRTIYFTSVQLKGKAYELPVYQVSGEKDGAVLSLPSSSGLTSPAATTTSQKRSFKTTGKKKTATANARPSMILPASVGSGLQAIFVEEEASESQKLAAANPANVKAQVSAITEAPKLKLIRENALQRLFDEREKAGVLEKALSSFARASEKGLKMGSGRARNAEEEASGMVSPPPVAISPSRSLKAAQITFNSCSTAAGSDALSTVFTLPLVNGIDTVFDLKDAALTRLGNRQLLTKGPQADRAYFSFSWNQPGKSGELRDESVYLDDLREANSAMIKLTLVEHETKQGEEEDDHLSSLQQEQQLPMKRSTTMSFSISNTPRARLESARSRLLDRHSPSGSIVVLEGMQGVGKTFLAEDVFLRGDIVSSALSGVAMGNPYENELAVNTLNVWTLLLRQVLEETLVFREMAPNDVSRLLVICHLAVQHINPNFTQMDLLDELCECALDSGHLPKRILHSLPETQSLVDESIEIIANLIAGLSITYLPVVVLVDDSHFMDVASWQMVNRLAALIDQRQARVLVLLLHRNIIQPETFATIKKSEEMGEGSYNNMRALENKFTKNRREIGKIYLELLGKPCVDFVEKKSDVNDTEQIVKDRLEIDTIQGLQPLITFLKLKTQGNRLFIHSFLDDLIDADLLTCVGKTCTLPERFGERLKYHELPLPSNVEGICATLLDSMSISQQMALKVAAIIGERFTLNLVTALFPIAHLKPSLGEEWQTLVRLGVVVEDTVHSKVEQWFVFSNPWMLETLRKRMLLKQRRKLAELYRNTVDERERELNQKFMESAVNKLSISQTGYLAVKKENARNVLQPWKRRWVVLQEDELIQYYEENNTVKRLEVIKLSAPGTTISNKIGGFIGAEGGTEGKHYPFCFVIHAKKWSKKDVNQTKPRDFYMAPDSLVLQKEWVFKVGFQIDFFKIKADEEAKRTMEAKRALVANLNVESIVAGFASGNGVNNSGSREKSSGASLSTPPVVPLQTEPKFFHKLSRPSFNMSMVKSRPKSQVPIGVSPNKSSKNVLSGMGAMGTDDGEYAEPGKHILTMTAANFKAISRDEALATFWATDNTTFDEVMVLRSGHHITFFYELGDMALVSLNGNSAVDGYLLGFMSSRSPEVAVIHQVAVLPMVRRRGIATKLFQEFFELARRKGCQTVRALIPKDSHGARAFHQKMGFDLNPDEALLDGLDLNVFTLQLYKAAARSNATTLGTDDYDDEEEEEEE